MSKEGIPPREFGLQYIRGLPMYLSPRFLKENFEAAVDNQPQDGDTIIISYPKTGSTWLQYIVLQILSKGKHFPSLNDLMLKEAPYLELAGIAALEDLNTPRSYKLHLPYYMVKKNEKAKYIYIHRHPEDTLLSSYHHACNVTFNSDFDFDDYVEHFISANVAYGSYFEHVKSYLSHRDDNNLLILTYESLHKNTKGEILKIAKFLGEDYFNAISNDDSLFNTIIRNTSFENMKKSLFYILPDTLPNYSWEYGPQKVEFFRKGTAGEGKKYLSPDQQKRLREVAEKVLEGNGVINEWYLK